MTYKIESGLPMPVPRSEGLTAKMRELAVGQSLLLKGGDNYSAPYVVAKRLGIEITSRMVRGRQRIWRSA